MPTATDTATPTPTDTPAPNNAPLFVSTPVTSISPGQEYIYNIFVLDAEGSAGLTIRADVLPAWLAFTDTLEGTATLFGRPADADVGVHEVRLIARDAAGAETEQRFELHVFLGQ